MNEYYELFKEFYDEGWTPEFDGDVFSIWICPDGERLEADHPDAPPRVLGLI